MHILCLGMLPDPNLDIDVDDLTDPEGIRQLLVGSFDVVSLPVRFWVKLIILHLYVGQRLGVESRSKVKRNKDGFL